MSDKTTMQLALEALRIAQHSITLDRQHMADSHMDPVTNRLDADGALGVSEYNAHLAQIDAAIEALDGAIASQAAPAAQPVEWPCSGCARHPSNAGDTGKFDRYEPAPAAQPVAEPPESKPLSDDEILRLLRPSVWMHVEGHSRERMLADARAIERFITEGNGNG